MTWTIESQRRHTPLARLTCTLFDIQTLPLSTLKVRKYPSPFANHKSPLNFQPNLLLYIPILKEGKNKKQEKANMKLLIL